MPQKEGGILIAPPVSLPSDARPRPAATAAADPPDDPPGMYPSFHGFWHVPKCGLSLVTPAANSWRFVLPTRTAPASASRAVAVASPLGTESPGIRGPADVRLPPGQPV